MSKLLDRTLGANRLGTSRDHLPNRFISEVPMTPLMGRNPFNGLKPKRKNASRRITPRLGRNMKFFVDNIYTSKTIANFATLRDRLTDQEDITDLRVEQDNIKRYRKVGKDPVGSKNVIKYLAAKANGEVGDETFEQWQDVNIPLRKRALHYQDKFDREIAQLDEPRDYQKPTPTAPMDAISTGRVEPAVSQVKPNLNDPLADSIPDKRIEAKANKQIANTERQRVSAELGTSPTPSRVSNINKKTPNSLLGKRFGKGVGLASTALLGTALGATLYRDKKNRESNQEQ